MTTSRITYQSPEGRVRVECDGPRDYALYLDGEYSRNYPSSSAAEVAGGVWLNEQAEQLSTPEPEPAPTCELCEGPAVLVGEQWTCPECCPIREPAVCCEHCGEVMAEPADAALVGAELWCPGCVDDNTGRLAAMGTHYVLMDATPSIITVVLPVSDEPEPTPPAPAGGRLLWRWAGTAEVLGQLVAKRRAA